MCWTLKQSRRGIGGHRSNPWAWSLRAFSAPLREVQIFRKWTARTSLNRINREVAKARRNETRVVGLSEVETERMRNEWAQTFVFFTFFAPRATAGGCCATQTGQKRP